jgi:hypothetical protein
VEIAEKVLQRGDTFNPLDDASVRKLGTALRQRLERYYESEGAGDPVRISLPVRSYIPVFEVRDREVDLEPVPVPAPRRSRRWILAGGLGVAAAAGSTLWLIRPATRDAHRVFLIRTQQGDLMHKRNDVAPGGLLLGPQVGTVAEVTARMVFTPERATQQAGILVFGDPDHYVKLGRQFLSRPQLEFGFENEGHYGKPPGTFDYDPAGQTGEPVWLSIRRRDQEYRGVLSHDGLAWRPFGNLLTVPTPMDTARAAVYAHNGRSDAPSAEARFDQVSVGHAFHHLEPGPFDVARFPGWSVRSDTGDAAGVRLDGECLAVDFPTAETTRSFELLRVAPPGDWMLSTRLDFLSVNGSTAGLVAMGPKARFRFIRWDLDGGSITAELLGHRQVNRKDFEGGPPLILRLTCQRGMLRYSFSRDNRQFIDVPLEVPVSALADKELSIGLHTSTSSWKLGDPRRPARFFYLRQELDELSRASL